VRDGKVNKAQLSKSVVDDTNVTRLFSSRDLEELFRLEHPDPIPDEQLKDFAPKLVLAPVYDLSLTALTLYAHFSVGLPLWAFPGA
jgi:hypothetical protein